MEQVYYGFWEIGLLGYARSVIILKQDLALNKINMEPYTLVSNP